MSQLVEHGTQYDTIGSIWSTSVGIHGVIGTPSSSVICPIIFMDLEVHQGGCTMLFRIYGID